MDGSEPHLKLGEKALSHQLSFSASLEEHDERLVILLLRTVSTNTGKKGSPPREQHGSEGHNFKATFVFLLTSYAQMS